MRASIRRALVLALLLAAAPTSHAQIWNRTAKDGTVEFTNRPRGGAGWTGSQKQKGAGGQPGASSAGVGGTFWSRERDDGVVEFTNLPPIGSRWKVWLKAGPGKASATRGGTDTVPPRDASPTRFSRYDQHIRDQQAFFGIPEALMRAVMKTESDFDPQVISSAGARGLMQLMPDTARLMGVTDIFDPRQNVMGGARYLQVLARRFCKTPTASADGAGAVERLLVCSYDEKVKVIAGYHAGPGAVMKYGGMPPYETTRFYVTAVLRRYEQYRQAEASGNFGAER